MSPEESAKAEPAVSPLEVLSGVAERILVPVANPATAEGLLRLAISLAGKDGRVVAAYVILSGTEPRANALEAIEAIIEELNTEGASVELVTDIATSIARGILDMIQELNADLVVLGVRGRQQDRVVLGPVVDAVARTAPCNVIMYRGIKELWGGEGYRQVIVPVDGSSNSWLAARIGLRFAHHIDSPMTALYVQTDSSMRRWQALGMIEASLEGIEEVRAETEIRKIVEHASDVVTGILNRSADDALILLGFSEESSLDSWIFGDIPQRILSRAPGPLILVKQNVGEHVTKKVGHRLSNLIPTLTPSEELEVVHMAREMARPTNDFFVLVVLSCLIASLGLLLNSPAVIIGAMLVAPLMSPLMGFAVGLIRGDWHLMRIAFTTLLRGIGMALLVAVIIGLLAPLKEATSEMLARAAPTLPDLGVALFSGMAGAYAVARKDIPSALAGVAIAAALMPPLCTVGIALAFGQAGLASGAFFLFVMNITAISLGGGAIFVWLGVRLRSGADNVWSYRGRLALSILVLVLLAIPLTRSLQTSTQAALQKDSVWQVLREAFSDQVVDVEWQDGEQPQIVATVRVLEPPTQAEVAALEEQVSARMGQAVRLELVIWQRVPAAGP